jgi:hypothetical protein
MDFDALPVSGIKANYCQDIAHFALLNIFCRNVAASRAFEMFLVCVLLHLAI